MGGFPERKTQNSSLLSDAIRRGSSWQAGGELLSSAPSVWVNLNKYIRNSRHVFN